MREREREREDRCEFLGNERGNYEEVASLSSI
jgi:hypothetical protein